MYMHDLILISLLRWLSLSLVQVMICKAPPIKTRVKAYSMPEQPQLSPVVGWYAGQFFRSVTMPAQSWLAYEITNSPLKLTLVMAMQAIPMVLFSLFSGVIVDRVQKRNVIVITQSFNVLVTLAIAILLAIGKIQYWHLLVSSLLSGINIAFNMPARNAILAELVPREKIYNAIALNNGGANVAAIAGPALSGIIIGLFNIQSAYYVAIAFYIAPS
jgi:MFS family permease